MTISLRATPTWVAVIMAGLLLAGCGGADEESTTESSATSTSSSSSASDQSSSDSEPEAEPDQMSESEADQTAESEPAQTADEGDQDASAESADQTAAADDAVTVDEDGVAQVSIGATDQMQYTVNEFSVEAGQEVELTLNHEGQLGVESMGHNVVILQAGEDYVAFAREVTNEGGSVDNDYLPESMRDGLVAYTDLIGGGESDTITFTAPDEPGEYPFVCTFPGHFGMMNGVMIVR